MINLDNEEFDSKSVSIFNNGIAGRTACTFDGVVAKSDEDKPTSPAFKVVFKDAEGASVNVSFWNLEDPSDSRYERKSKSDGKKFKALIQSLCGPSTPMPKANTMPELLLMTMKLIKDKVGAKVFVMTNYGAEGYPSKFLNIRNWTPFIEPATISESESNLKFMSFEFKEKVETEDAAKDISSEESADWE